MGSVGLSTVGAGFYTLGKEVLSVDDAIRRMIESVGGNPDHRCYEIPKGEMRFPCLHDLVGDYEWVELERRPEGAVGRCICGKTFWWKER